MKADFHDACLRHLEDAEVLYENQRWANADHLFGIAAECGMKRLMIALGMPLDSNDTPHKKDKVHANELWIRYESYRSGNPQAGCYALWAADPFQDWDVYQRYGHRTHFNQQRVDPHRNGAQAVRAILKRAERDGLL